MKVQEVLLENDSWLLPRLADMLSSYDDPSQAFSNVVVNGLLQRYPNLAYTGKMYRYIEISPKQLRSLKTNSDVIKFVKQYSKPGKSYWSFSKSEAYLSYVGHPNEVVPKFNINACIILTQVGTGLDIEKVLQHLKDVEYTPFKEYPEYHTKVGDDYAIQRAARAQEVIAPIDNSIRPILYGVQGEHPKERRGTRYGHNYPYRSDDLNQLKKALALHRKNTNAPLPKGKELLPNTAAGRIANARYFQNY